MIRVIVRAAYAHDKKAAAEAARISRLIIPEDYAADRLAAEAAVEKSLYREMLRVTNS